MSPLTPSSPDGQDQTLELDYDLLLRTLPPGGKTVSGSLSSTQDAEVQVSTDSGTTWSTITSSQSAQDTAVMPPFLHPTIHLASWL